MKVGDLVKSIKPWHPEIGVIVENTRIPGQRKNKVWTVLWSTGVICGMWDYDLKVINESR